MTTNETLKPCPFCGSHNIDISNSFAFKDYSVFCATCGAESGCASTREGSIQMWNMRPFEQGLTGIPASVLRGEDSDEGT